MNDLRAKAEAALSLWEQKADALAESLFEHADGSVDQSLLDETLEAGVVLYEALYSIIEAAGGVTPEN
jgi:hypothetical protein